MQRPGQDDDLWAVFPKVTARRFWGYFLFWYPSGSTEEIRSIVRCGRTDQFEMPLRLCAPADPRLRGKSLVEWSPAWTKRKDEKRGKDWRNKKKKVRLVLAGAGKVKEKKKTSHTWRRPGNWPCTTATPAWHAKYIEW